MAAPDPPRLSVVIPVYSPDLPLFRAALQSLLDQTFRNFELFIVEDPSAIAVEPLVRELADPRVKFHRNEVRTSQAAKYNWGLARAKGEYLARFDADDIAEPHRFETQIKFLDTHPDIDIVGSDLTLIDENDRVIGLRDYPHDHEAIVGAMHRYNPIASPSVMFRRRVYEQSGGWSEQPVRPARDYDWASRMALAGHRFANLPDRLVRYRIHSGGVKQKSLRETILATVDIKRAYWLPTMTARGRVLMFAESLLRFLPRRLVLWLFLRLRGRRA